MSSKIILLVRDGQQATNYTTDAETIESLAQELGIQNYGAAVNGTIASSDTTFVQGDAVSIVAKDKTGGEPSGTYVRTKKKLGRPSKEDFQAGGFHLSKSVMAKLKTVASFEGKTMDQYASEIMHNHMKNVQVKITTKRS
tara:strand:- start:115 stop:534 length:420 start_codon:yes stop_codon:yes gene_type:complete